MFICEACHEKRQKRTYQEFQPLQWSGYKTRFRNTCIDCGADKRNILQYKYQSAYELHLENAEFKARFEILNAELPAFPFAGADCITDCEELLTTELTERERALALYCRGIELLLCKACN